MKSNLGYIRDMLEHIDFIESFLDGVSESQLYKNKEKEFAIIRSFEVIGEAKKVSHDIKVKHPKLPWRKMAGFRDVLIHDYDRVVAEVIWVTAKQELPSLKRNLQELLQCENH